VEHEKVVETIMEALIHAMQELLYPSATLPTRQRP